jgi:putative ABC transport system permease protein
MTTFEDVRHDVRYACRVLFRNPGFAAAAVATLALGIGASTAIFSVAYGVSLRPLPYPEPDRLVRIYEANPANGQLKHKVSTGAFHEWREEVRSIESAALFGQGAIWYLTGPDAISLSVMSVSPSFFDVIGVRPALGSGFGPEADYRDVNDEVVISHDAWQRLLGGRPDVLGQRLEFERISARRIVGVMPEGFRFDRPVDVWMPTAIVQLPVTRMLRQWRFDQVVARLRPGATMAQARAELEAVSARLAEEFPATNAGWTVTVESLHDATVGEFGHASWLLFLVVAVVLVVACVNVGGLLAARAATRWRETAVRIALGAGAWRLARLWLAEAALLSLLGAGLGLLLAWSGVSALTALAPPGIPRLDAIALDLPVVGVAVASGLIAIAITTLAPLGLGRTGAAAHALRSGSGAGESKGRHTLRHALTVAQCAGAAVLVVFAVMLARSLVNLTTVDLGWNAAGVLSLNARPPMPPELRRPWARYVEWSDRLVAALEGAPGIQRAAITTQIPLSPLSYPGTLGRGRGQTASDDARWPVVQHNVTDGFFETMGIRLLEGRTFGRDDRFSTAQVNWTEKAVEGAAIVSASAARALWPGTSAVGQPVWLPDIDNVTWRRVIGVVEDIHFHDVGETPALHVFVPWTQHATGAPRLLVKGTTTGAAIAPLVRQVVEAVEPGTRVDHVMPLETLFARATAQPRFTSRLVALFGALALLLAAIGIYGTLAYVVRARNREIGIRLALGASPGRILSRTLAFGLAPVVAGGVLGIVAAVALARAFHAMFFEVAPLDPGSIVAGTIVLLAVSVAAALGPALRASRVDPAVTLRAE